MAGEGGDGGDWNEAHSRCESDAREKQSGNGRAGNGKAGVARENKSERTHARKRANARWAQHAPARVGGQCIVWRYEDRTWKQRRKAWEGRASRQDW